MPPPDQPTRSNQIIREIQSERWAGTWNHSFCAVSFTYDNDGVIGDVFGVYSGFLLRLAHSAW